MPKVFVSHSASDRAVVMRDIVELLNDHDLETWFAETDIAAARRWERSILEGLKSCDWFLVALTPRAAQSEWVKDEVHWAIQERPDRIVPVLVEDCDATEIHIRLPRIHHVDFREVTDDARRRLLASLGVEYRPAARYQVRFNSLGDRYRIEEHIHPRDFPREFIGTDSRLDRRVLIKCDPPDRRYDDGKLSAVANEAHALAMLFHPSIPRALDLASDADLGVYSVLEFVPGTSLRDRIRQRQRMPWPKVVDLIRPICEAVHHVHEKGLLHRNLKPESITIGEDEHSFLTNFIVARLPDNDRRESGTVGTPAYMSPEQCKGHAEADRRVDVWGLGVVLYELLTGRVPFRSGAVDASPIALIDAIIRDQPPPPREHDPSIPVDLEEICLTCLQKDPGRRYSSALDVASALKACSSRDRSQNG